MDTESSSVSRDDGPFTEQEQDKIREELRRLRKDSQFFDQHLSEWRRQYSDMHVAIYGEKLVCVAASGMELLQCLEEKNIPVEDCFCKFVPSSPAILAPANWTVFSD